MLFKQVVANSLKHIALLRWGLSLGVRLFAPKNQVGVVGAIFNDAGQVLMVEHVFRPNFPWGLPGGWVNRGEDPACAVRREVQEELNLTIQVKQLLICQPQGGGKDRGTPLGLGLAFYCRLRGENSLLQHIEREAPYEILAARWVNPQEIDWELVPLQQKAIVLGQRLFKQEQLANHSSDEAGER